MNKPTIICVDDEMLVLSSLRSFLGNYLGSKYAIEIAESAEEAMDVISELIEDNTEIPLIITDQLMPGIKGDELLTKIHARYPKVLKILLTGQASVEAVGNAVNQANLYRYIAKPWDESSLAATVQEALHRYFHDQDLTEVNQVLSGLNAHLEAKVADRTAELQYRVQLEQLIANISSQFIRLTVDQVDAGIQSALQQLGEFAQVDRSYLFQASEMGTQLSNTHEWCAPGIESQQHRLQETPLHTFPWIMTQLQQLQVVHIPSAAELPAIAQAEHAELTARGIQSLLWVPIASQDQLFGFVGFDAVRHPKIWTADSANSLRVVGEIFANALERQQIEHALQESRERFRRAFADAAIGMAIVALDGSLLQVNPAYCAVLGYSEAELLARTVQDLTHPDDLHDNLGYLRRAAAGEISHYQMEKRYIHQHGHTLWALLTVSLVRDLADTPLHFVAQIQDVSDRHELNRIKDEFISIVSHELRTPLTAIQASLDILESGAYHHRPERAQAMLKIAINNSDRLERLIDNILDLERLESGSFQLVMQPCNAADLIQEAADAVEAIILRESILLHLAPVTATVWANPDAIVQTLTNLLSNAIKFSPSGSTLWLSAEPWETEDFATPTLRFALKDSGRGIPADKLESIFGRFQQVDVSDSRKKNGTGLGLAICDSIIRQHGGLIWAESVLGVGSTFYFTLAIAQRAHHPDESAPGTP